MSAGSAPPPFQARLEEQLGRTSQFERFSSQLLDGSETVMSRAYALRRLAQQFPPDVERQLNAGDRRCCATWAGNMSRRSPAVRRDGCGPEPHAGCFGRRCPSPASSLGIGRVAARQRGIAERRPARRDGSRCSMVWRAPENPADNMPSAAPGGVGATGASQEHCQRLLSYDDVRQSRSMGA